MSPTLCTEGETELLGGGGHYLFHFLSIVYLFHTLPQANYLFHFLRILFSVYKVGSQTRLSIDVGGYGDERSGTSQI